MRLPTGIAGFDEMIEGGFPANANIVLQGPAGQEKMRLALTFLAVGLRSGSSGLVVTSSQSPDVVLGELRNLGVDLDAVVRENRLRIVDWYTQREEPVQDVEERGIVLRSSIDLTNVGVALSRGIAALGGDKPKRAVVELLSPAMNLYEVSQVYAFAQSCKGKFVRFSFTALFLIEKEMHSGPELSTLHQPFDGLVELERTRIGDNIVRKIGVVHLKDTTPDTAFRVLEATPQGPRVVKEAVKPTSTPPPPVPPSPKPSPPPKAKPPVGPPVPETKEESPTRAYLIMQIARERLRLNPSDSDALFAIAAAQATLDDARGALEALEQLAQVDERYPGLWVLKTKLHARLGDVVRARQSRAKAEAIRDVEGLTTEIFVECPICEAQVSESASRCPKCGAKFLQDEAIAEELDALGQAAIQEKVQEELGAEDLLGVKPELTRKPVPSKPKPTAQVAAPPREAAKPSAKQGLTNGLVREGGTRRPAGMTNGLRGRTNGLTNGLRGRTNGLTNGLARTTGMTNGLVNGLAATKRGLTNGLTNGNGFTNGLGSPRFQREVRLNRWKLYVIPLVAIGLLIVPLFTPSPFAGPSYPIQIDGAFDDWSAVPKVPASASAVSNPNTDILEVAVKDNIDYLSFYVEVQGTALQGGPVPDRVTDTFFLFLDLDRSARTGYQVQGLGADRLIEIVGWGGEPASARMLEFDANRDARDWGGWFKGASVSAAASGSRLEFQADWDAITLPKRNIDVAFVSKGYDGRIDVGETTATSADAYLVVAQDSASPQLVTGTLSNLLQLTLRAVGGDVRVTSLNVTLQGTFVPSTLSSMALLDVSGLTLSQEIVVGRAIQFDSLSLLVPRDGSATLVVRPSVAADDGTTIGAHLASPGDVVVAQGGVALTSPPTSPESLAYVGALPAAVRVDGGFADWPSVTPDPTGDASPSWRRDLDIVGHAFQGSSGNTFFLVRTDGTALGGTIAPLVNSPFRPGPSSPDADRDTVPDAADLFPYDFNNDGVQDVASGNDYDGDGVLDYGIAGGTDQWLNTTIPLTFPAPYAGTSVNLFIGPVERPVAKGEDTARFYLDQDGSAGTGYAMAGVGAEYLVEITGKSGQILGSTALRFTGLSPGEWSWSSVGPAEAMKDRSRLEAGLAGVAVTNASRAYVQIAGWSGEYDDVTPDGPARTLVSSSALRALGFASGNPPATSATGDFPVKILDIAGNQKWFFTNGATSPTLCSTNYAASGTAGSSAASTTLIGTSPTICWYTALDPSDVTVGQWEAILDIDKTTDGTKVLRSSAQGDSNAWSAAGCLQASAYQCVDDDPNDGDTSYIVSNASTTTDSLFNIFDWTSTPAPPSPLSIVNVVVTASCGRAGGGAVDVRILLKSGGTTSVGGTSTNCANSATYTVWTDTWTTDPSDGLAWTLADINALQVGVRDNDATTREVRASHAMATVTWVPVHSVQIEKCTTSDCTSRATLYGPTNGNTYGSDVTFTSSSLGSQTFDANSRVRFKVELYVDGSSTPGSVTVRYNGANPGTDDSRATSPPPPFASTMGDIAVGTGGAASDLYGYNVTGVGKVNENSGGYEDFLVGAPNVDFGGQNDRGAIYLFFGSASWAPSNVNAGSANVVIYGAATGDHFGWSLAAANDVNGDGYADILAGSPDATQGKAYLIYGRADWSAANGASIASVASVVTITGQNTGDKFGGSVAGVGNLDNSGNADFAVGAYTYGSNRGRVYVFYGDGSIATKAVDADVRLDGAVPGDKFGFSVAGAGNVNNDNYADLVVGAPGASKAYVYTLAINLVANGHLAADATGWTYAEVDPNGFDSGAWENTGSSDADISGAGSYKFAFTDSSSSLTLYFHSETITVNGASGNGLHPTAVDQGVVSSSVTAFASGDHLLIGTWTALPLGVTTLPAATWTFTYNAQRGVGITDGHIDVHLFKRVSAGTLYAIDGTSGADSVDGVAASAALGTTAADYTGTYSMSVQSFNTTDALVIKVYGHAVTVGGGTRSITFNYDALTANSRVVTTAGFPDVRYLHVETATINTFNVKQLLTTNPDAGSIQTVTTTQSATGHYFLGEWSTPQLGITSIPAGDWLFFYWGDAPSQATVHFDVHIYKRSGSGTLTSLDGTDGQNATDGVAASSNLATSTALYLASVNPGAIALASADAIVVRLYAHYTAVSGSRTTTFEYDTQFRNSRFIFPAVPYTDRMSIVSSSSFTSPPGTFTNVRYRIAYSSTVTAIGDAFYNVKYEVRNSGDTSTVATAYDSGSLTTAQSWALQTGTVSGLSANTAYKVRALVEVYNVHESQTPSLTVNVDDMELEFEIVTTLTGTASTNFGWAVSTAGNVNNDATPYKDVLVGAPDDGSGKAFIYYGSASFDFTVDVTITGATPGDRFGYAVSAAGDSTGDLIDDVVVGAPYNDNVATDAGAVYAFAGSSALASSIAASSAIGVRYGETANDHLGWSVSYSNPDGTGDTEVLAGAPHFDNGANTDAGKVYVMKVPEFGEMILPIVGGIIPVVVGSRLRRRKTVRA